MNMMMKSKTTLEQNDELEICKANDSNKTVNSVLGVSNCKTLGKIAYDCSNASIPGAMIENITETTA